MTSANSHPDYPETLVTTQFVDSCLSKPGYRIVEVDLDPTMYSNGHVPGAQLWDWKQQLRNPKTHQMPTREEFQELLCLTGIKESDVVILYGDNNNWFACWAMWLLKMHGHAEVYLMDGGSRKWFMEERFVSCEIPAIARSEYELGPADLSSRATMEDVFRSVFDPNVHKLIDVRSSYEYQGIAKGPIGVEANCAVAGHIPNAINIPWSLNCNVDGTFKSKLELRELYASFGITENDSVITCCAIGERASLSWFVLKHLLCYPVVMNYDRSMAEWSRIENAPIVLGEAA
ncbi:MAG: sulfurtransferase [Fimbriimonadaceae bacterium]